MKKLKITLKNAVVYKDMTVNSKKINLALTIFILNLIFTICASCLVFGINVLRANNDIFNPQNFAYIFDGVVITLCAFMTFLIPSITAPAIVGEKERQTFDVLLTTNLSYFDIVLGKFLSAFSYIVLILVGTFPFIALILAYGALSIWQLFFVFLGMIIVALVFTSVGIWASAVAAKTSHASLLAFLLYFTLIIGTILATTFTKLIATGIVERLFGYTSGSVADWSMCFLLLNPATTAYDMLDRYVGLVSELGVEPGMGFMFETFCDTGKAAVRLLSRYWSIFAIAVQLLLSFFFLWRASVRINPARMKIKKHSKVKTKKNAGKE